MCAALTSAPYKFASSMPKFPHEYTLRRNWDDRKFSDCVRFVREHGYPSRFYGRNDTYLDINGMHHWDMNASVEATELINRAKKKYPNPYDDIAIVYDSLFTDKASEAQSREAVEMSEVRKYDRVLDIGCGTGLLLDYCNPESYTGIDISGAMLEELCRKHPERRDRVIRTSFEDFYGTGYDCIVALFGVAAYISEDHLKRIPWMLNDGGCAFLMFYAPDYSPVTYLRTNTERPNYYNHPVLSTDERFGNYIVRRIRK